MMISFVEDKPHASGSQHTQFPISWPALVKAIGYIIIKVDGYAQGFILLKVSCVTKCIALLFTVYGMVIPLPSNMVSSLVAPSGP